MASMRMGSVDASESSMDLTVDHAVSETAADHTPRDGR
jgi:hypothetical protein